MECPTCGAGMATAAAQSWGAAAGNGARTAPAEVVAADTVADTVNAPPERSLIRLAPPAPELARTPASLGARMLPARLGVGFPAHLWRQPAVRAAVRAGAGALALSVGLRLGRVVLARALARGGPRPLAATPPLVVRLPAAPAPGSGPRGGEIVETWIYVRQQRTGR